MTETGLTIKLNFHVELVHQLFTTAHLKLRFMYVSLYMYTYIYINTIIIV